MVNTIDKHAKHIIQSGLTYWDMVVSQKVPSLSAIRKESSNIKSILIYGAKTQDTWQSTASLALKLSPFIETNLNWYEWIPVIKSLVKRTPRQQRNIQLKLMLKLGNLYRISGQITSAIQYHNESHLLAKDLKDELYIGLSLYELAFDHVRLGKYKESLNRSTLALKYIEQHGNVTQLANTLMQQATIHRLLGNYSQAETLIREALLYRDAKTPSSLTAKTHYEMANILESLGKVEEAHQAYSQAEETLLQIGDSYQLAYLYLGWGTLYHNLEQYHQAHQLFEKVDRNYLIESGHQWFLAFLENNTGSNLLTMGDVFRATPYLYRAVQQWDSLGNQLRKAVSLGMLAKAHNLEGKSIQALNEYAEAIAILQKKEVTGFFLKELTRFIEEKAALEEQVGE